MATGDIKLRYGTAASYTISLNSLASSSTLLVGRQSTVVDNTSALADDYLVSGKIKTGTNPSAGAQIEVWAFGDIDLAGGYQSPFGASDAGVTISQPNLKPLQMRNLAVWSLDSGIATGAFMYFNNVSLKSLFGYVPGHHGIFVTQNTGAALDGSAGGTISYAPVYWQYV
jgi:hypothetical protein